MSKEKKGMPDEIMSQVRNNYKNFEDVKKREKEPTTKEDMVQKGYEPGEGFKRVFSRMIGDTPEASVRARAPKRNGGFNKIFASLVGEANLSYSNSEARRGDDEATVGSETVIEAPPSPVDSMEVNASAPGSDQTSVFERLSRATSEEPSHRTQEQAVEASSVKEELAPTNHKMSVFERLSKHKV